MRSTRDLLLSWLRAIMCLKTHSVLVTQDFTRTNLIRDLTLENPWFNPLFHPEAIDEELVK